MKKLYTLIAAALLALPVAAQDFSIENYGKAVEDGGEITVLAEEKDYGFIMVECESNPNSQEGLMLNMKSSADVMVQARDLTGSGKRLLLCCGGTCQQGSGQVTKQFTANAGESIPFQYGINLNEGDYGTVRTEVTVTTAKQTQKFYVNFTYNDPSAVDPADLNGDGSVNVGDVTTLVNMILQRQRGRRDNPRQHDTGQISNNASQHHPSFLHAGRGDCFQHARNPSRCKQ